MGKSPSIGEKYYIHSIITAFFVVIIYFFGINNSFFYSSIVQYKGFSGDTFDGTISPISYVPNPLILSRDERNKNFEEIDSKFFIPLPKYNPSIFGKDIDSLTPGSQEYKDSMTQKLIYTVPYMSTYNFDYKEYSGSHPAVDIIAPIGTPVMSIANGFIVDSGFQPGGFGNYVVIKHSNIHYGGKKQDIYSVYAHLSQIKMTHGNKVKKGEYIGLVGDTGTATTSHLHFQIDTQDAPYTPYWPFSASNMKNAGVGMFEAINIGLGREDALKYTLNPMKFVNDFFSQVDFAGGSEIQEEELEDDVSIQEEISSKNDDEENILDEKEEQQDEQKEDEVILGNEVEREEDIEHDIVKQLTLEEKINLDVELLSALEIQDLVGSMYDDLIFPEQEEELREKDLLKEDTIYEEKIELPENKKEGVNEENFEKEEENKQENVHGETSQQLFSDIKQDYQYYKELEYFKQKGIVNGFGDNSFRPNGQITRVESLKIILLSFGISPVEDQVTKFRDVDTHSWENTYVNAGVEIGIIDDKNTLFSPFRNVSRVEALKLILNLGNVDLESGEDNIFIEDVGIDEWYYKYVVYAINNHLIEFENGKVYPNQAISREELIKILYQYMN